MESSLAETTRLTRRVSVVKVEPSLAWVQTEWPWRGPRRGVAERQLRKDRFTPRRAIKDALRALQRAEKRNAPQEVLREKYFALEAAMSLESEHAEQLELELFETLRLRGRGDQLDRYGDLLRVGKDPNPHAPFAESALEIQKFAEVFPAGMTFAEIAWCLGLRHKQHAQKIYARAVAKMLRAFGSSADEIRAHLRTEGARVTNWDQMVGTE